ncbi:MAG: D-alanine--D-alanine ligase [Bacilli bacterium]|nr:D-alanine--D-alanine ligase [Bacilli bacterium]
MKIKVGVIFGGETVEHEVSIISAVQAMGFMDADKYDIIPIYISKDRIWYTGPMLKEIDVYKDFEELKRYAKKCVLFKKDNSFYLQSTGFFKRILSEIDIAFPIVHGNNVEDGSLAGYLDTLGIPYVGPKVLGAAMGQDKVIMKQVMASENIPITDYEWFYDTEYLTYKDDILKAIKKIGYPVIVKPATLGSSVGISVAKSEKEIEDSIMEAMKYDVKIVVEKVVANLVEVNCSVLGNYASQETSVLEEVMSKDEFLTYAEKYIGNGKGMKTKGKMAAVGSKGMASADRIIPARISKEMSDKVVAYAKQTFKALNLSGVCRIDFLIDKKTGDVFVNEPNTIPGSLAFYLWEPAGKEYHSLLDDMITLAIKEYKNKSKKTYSFDTNILSNFDGLKGLKGLKGMKGKLRK